MTIEYDTEDGPSQRNDDSINYEEQGTCFNEIYFTGIRGHEAQNAGVGQAHENRHKRNRVNSRFQKIGNTRALFFFYDFGTECRFFKLQQERSDNTQNNKSYTESDDKGKVCNRQH